MVIDICQRKAVDPYPLNEFFQKYDESVQKRDTLRNFSDHFAGRISIEPRTLVGDQQPLKQSYRKGNYTQEEDTELLEFVLSHPNQAGGRLIYKEYSATHPWRTFESYRTRYKKHLKIHVDNFNAKYEVDIPRHILMILRDQDLEGQMEPSVDTPEIDSSSSKENSKSPSKPLSESSPKNENAKSASASIPKQRRAQKSRQLSDGEMSDVSMFRDERPEYLDEKNEQNISESANSDMEKNTVNMSRTISTSKAGSKKERKSSFTVINIF